MKQTSRVYEQTPCLPLGAPAFYHLFIDQRIVSVVIFLIPPSFGCFFLNLQYLLRDGVIAMAIIISLEICTSILWRPLWLPFPHFSKWESWGWQSERLSRKVQTHCYIACICFLSFFLLSLSQSKKILHPPFVFYSLTSALGTKIFILATAPPALMSTVL